jgi:hypothetical protein
MEVDRAERFGLVDTQTSVRGDWQIGPRTSVYATVLVTPSADFREKHGVRAGISQMVMPHVEVGASARLGTYATGPNLALTPYLALSTKGETVTQSSPSRSTCGTWKARGITAPAMASASARNQRAACGPSLASPAIPKWSLVSRAMCGLCMAGCLMI